MPHAGHGACLEALWLLLIPSRQKDSDDWNTRVCASTFPWACLPMRTQVLINIVAEAMELRGGWSQKRAWRGSQSSSRCASTSLSECHDYLFFSWELRAPFAKGVFYSVGLKGDPQVPQPCPAFI